MAEALDDFSDLNILNEEDDSNPDEALFNRATEHVKSIVSKLDNSHLLELYSYYKQATEGPCSIPRPYWYELQKKQKWDAWNSLGDLDSIKAKSKYVNLVQDFDPYWLSGLNVKKGKNDSWVSVSTMYTNNEESDDNQKTIFDFCREGNVVLMKNIIKGNIKLLSVLDNEGLGLIHWAADRGHLAVLTALVESGCDVDMQDSSGQTALHYAVSCEHPELIRYLMDCGVNRNIKDEEGVTPLDLCTNESIKKLFYM